MRNSMKIAKWEIKRNMKNKSFIISLLLTPAIFLFFFLIPPLFNNDDSSNEINVFVLDELGVWDKVQSGFPDPEFENWNVHLTDLSETEMAEEVKDTEGFIYLALTKEGLASGKINVYMSDDLDNETIYGLHSLEGILREQQIEQLGLTDEQKLAIANGVSLNQVEVNQGAEDDPATGGTEEGESDPLKRLIPGVFAGVILFSIVMTGMMIFTSASQEKKEKVAEIILSSVTPTELMQGKIIGYFVLGMTQVVVWLACLLPLLAWKVDFSFLSYLLVPEMAILLVLAISGYLLFSAIFVAIGATVEDINSTSNFQGIVMMLPFIPVIFASPIISDPEGMVAKVASFIPITSPAVWIMRLSIMEEWPWIELVIGLIVLFVSIWFVMKMAGKIFKIGILMYGKNATPKEIWKWMWA